MTKLADIAREAKICTRCSLYRNATQTVFGEGPVRAQIMLVGEQPGDQEDLAGNLSSGRPAKSSIVRLRTPASTAAGSMSPTP